MKNLKFICILLSVILSASMAWSTTVFTIGDSTMANKPLDKQNPERGWGQMLPAFFSEEITVDNHAQNGRSSKSFMQEGRWDVVMGLLQPGDYVFIQFGHNDQPNKGARATTAGGDFNDNLRKYVLDTRSKGATPVLFTPIVRRKFDENGQLVDTHGAYVQAVRDVAKELDVPCIDMTELSHALVQTMGPERSKELYMHVAPGTCPLIPDGREDDTHFRARGARAMASMATEALAQEVPALKPYIRNYDLVVAQDGSGDFFTVQEAIDAVPVNRGQHRTTILVREGTYREKVTVPTNRTNISLYGQGNVVITYDDYASRPNRFGDELGTSGSSSFYIYAPDFYAENITFENTAGQVGQAVACFVSADRCTFKNCRFLGNQDTLYNHCGRQYFENCFIEGTVDFIFGKGTALFNKCQINAKRSKGYLTAPATPQGEKYGYVFYDCDLTADDGVENVWLGRPWRDYGQTVFVRCRMGAHVHPEGWHNWGKPEREATSFFAEVECTGPGSDASARKFGHLPASAAPYDPALVLKGDDNWSPLSPDPTPIKYP